MLYDGMRVRVWKDGVHVAVTEVWDEVCIVVGHVRMASALCRDV